VNYFGISTTVKITNTMSVVELTILAIVIVFGATYWKCDPIFFKMSHLTKHQHHSFWVASFLAIFLYTGYDSVVKLTEETKDSTKTVPKALITTIVMTTTLYVLLALTAICMPNISKVAKSAMPISEIVRVLFGDGAHIKIVYLIGLFIVLNTSFVCLVSLSRFVYGLSKEYKLPQALSYVNERYKTPHNAIIAVFVLISLALLVDNGEWTATFANVFFLVFLILLNLAVVILRIREPERERPFKIPFSIGKIPVLSIVGIISCVSYVMLAFCSTHKIG
jgi:APA family basic amino acid/polyamine antiporter